MRRPTVTTDADLQPAVAAELLALADLLDSASDAQWDTPSLCAGWRVREVIAHMTMAARYTEETFMAELRRCDFDFGRLSNEIAGRDAELPMRELVADLRSEVMQHWMPPGGGYHGALNHAVIHGLDVTVPLGVPRRPPDDTIRVVLDDLTEGGGHSTLAPASRGAASRPPISTGHTVRARRCAAPQATWHSCCAAGRFPPGGSRANGFSRRRLPRN
jgi:uncharacterized protein (TIGR03083 family)